MESSSLKIVCTYDYPFYMQWTIVVCNCYWENKPFNLESTSIKKHADMIVPFTYSEQSSCVTYISKIKLEIYNNFVAKTK